jgi:hypothetical protein
MSFAAALLYRQPDCLGYDHCEAQVWFEAGHGTAESRQEIAKGCSIGEHVDFGTADALIRLGGGDHALQWQGYEAPIQGI